jgi:CubicO group peptidase (beta-lactamase class C family)
MAGLPSVLKTYVDDGSLPGAVGLVVHGQQAEVAVAGSAAFDGAPMARDSIFRLASVTKPITAAAVMLLVEDGRIALDDPVSRWLPELAEPMVVRTPSSAADDLVPASRPTCIAR